jgi:hypothetical protein
MVDKQTTLIFSAILVLAIAIIFLTFSLVKYGKYVIGDPIQTTIDKTDLEGCVCYDNLGKQFKIGNLINSNPSDDYFNSVES